MGTADNHGSLWLTVSSLRFRQCLSALAYINKKKILHREIKTQNIFLMKTGDAKLGDFGISKVMDGTVAEAGTVVGTLLGCNIAQLP